MILNANTHTETNCTIQGNSFSIKASPIAFDILSNKLYSNPTLAVVRELLTNASDSQVAAGNTDKEIDVIFPNAIDNEFSIRDYGTGLSKKDVMTIYTTFFDSTKSNDNTFTGGFGLGSKTPFAYTSSFSITSFFNGMKYVFLATKKDGYPSILPLTEEPTDEPNGLYIRIPVNKDNGIQNNIQFLTEAKDYLTFIPEIKINSNKEIIRIEPFLEIDNIKLYNLSRKSKLYNWQYDQGIFIKQGQNVYNITSYFSYVTYPKTNDIFKSLDVVYEVPIGTLAITPSREQLSNDETNLDKIHKIVEIICKKSHEIMKYIIDNFDKLKNNNNVPKFLFSKYSKSLFYKYFNYSESLRDYGFNWTKDECTIQLSQFNIRNITLDSIKENPNFCNTNKYYLLYTYNTANQTLTRKLRNIISNYEELQDENTNIRLVNISYSWIYPEVRNEIARVRFLTNLVWTLNNAEELHFDIEFMSIKKFLKMFPNCKTPKKTTKTINKLTTKLTNVYKIDVINTIKSAQCKLSKEDIKEFTINNTLIVPIDTKTNSIQVEYVKFYEFFRNLTLQFKDINGNFFIGNYLLNKLNISMENMRFPQMYILVIAKGNLNKFKNYTTISFDELTDLVRTTDLKCYKDYTGHWQNYIYMFDQWVNNLKEPIKSFVQSTYLYKRHSLISHYGYSCKPLFTANYNTISCATKYYLQDTIKLDDSKFMALRDDFVNRVVNEELKILYYFIANRYRHTHKNCLTNQAKNLIIRYLRGEKHVLL